MSTLRSITGIALLLLLLVTSPVQPQILSLWANESMTAGEFFTEAPYTPFNIYVFLEPSPDGAFAVEYKLTVPEDHFSTALSVSPVVSGAVAGVWYGSPGISAPFTSCQTDLFWVVNLTMMSPNIIPGWYIPGPHDDSSFPNVVTCQGPQPTVEASIYNLFGYNDMWGATEETSWGAIKSLHR